MGREGRAELGLDRRASFQPFGRQRLAARDPGAACGRHDEAAAGARGHAAAGASSAACRRGMGDARSAVGRSRRFRRRPRLRPQGVRAVPGAVRRLGRAVRRRAGDRVARLDRARQVVAQGQVLPVRRRRDPAAAGADAAPALRRLLLAAVDGARGQQRLERDLRAVRRRHGLRLAGRCRARLSRDLRGHLQAADAARHVLLLRAHRLDAGRGAVRQAGAGTLFPGRADRGLPLRRRARRCRRPTSTSSRS